MVYESRVGDVFALGTHKLADRDITHDRVLVSPAPGQPGNFRSGTATHWADPLRSAALGKADSFRSPLAHRTTPRANCARAGLDEWAADNLIRYVKSNRNCGPRALGQDVGDRGDFVTSSVTGVSSCIHPSVRECTPHGRWRSATGFVN